LIDLCSGGAGPIPMLLKLLEQDHDCRVNVCLTDLHPNVDAFRAICEKSRGQINFMPDPVDATAVPRQLRGFRVLFNSFHHFKPEAARKILNDAVSSDQGIAIIEGIERTPASVLTCLLSLLTVPLVTPFIRPFRWSRYVFTYLLPLIPFVAAWDGIIS